MSTISKLSIQGVRSFTPDDAQVIAFRKPLTLIVGSNGSGKTVRRQPLAPAPRRAALTRRARAQGAPTAEYTRARACTRAHRFLTAPGSSCAATRSP